MESIKYFKFVGCFNLPDDFEGGYDDAVRLMLEYHLTKEKLDSGRHPPETKKDDKPWDVYRQVFRLWELPDIKLCMGGRIYKTGEILSLRAAEAKDNGG